MDKFPRSFMSLDAINHQIDFVIQRKRMFLVDQNEARKVLKNLKAMRKRRLKDTPATV